MFYIDMVDAVTTANCTKCVQDKHLSLATTSISISISAPDLLVAMGSGVCCTAVECGNEVQLLFYTRPGCSTPASLENFHYPDTGGSQRAPSVKPGAYMAEFTGKAESAMF